MESFELEINVENVAPNRGIGSAAIWVGFHDGSFDPVTVGELASDGIEILAEDGLVGLEEQLIPGILDEVIAAGLDPTKLPSAVRAAIAIGVDLSTIDPPPGLLAGDFLLSPAGMAGGTQGMIVTSIRKDPALFDLLDDPNAFSQEVLDSITNPYFFIQAPGETEKTKLVLNGTPAQNRYFSYAAMVFPTNDGLLANDNPQLIEVFNANGKFLGAEFTVLGNEILDAGTEVNDEAPDSLLYTFEAFASGADENGTIQPFPGFRAPGTGGVLDFVFNNQLVSENADFTAPGYEVLRFSISAKITGDEGANTLRGGVSNDSLMGKGNNDKLSGKAGDDLLKGGGGADVMRGDDGNDRLLGGGADDRLMGGDGDDILRGGGGNDRLKGDRGDDVLDGGKGRDRLTGGRGRDSFVVSKQGGGDRITDFKNGNDLFLLAGNLQFGQLNVVQNGNDTDIQLARNGTVLATLTGVNSNLIGSEDFQALTDG